MFFDRVERGPFLAGLVRDRDKLGEAEIGVVEGSEFVSFGAIDLGVAFPHHLDEGVLRREDFFDDGGGERIGFLGVIGAEGEELAFNDRSYLRSVIGFCRWRLGECKNKREQSDS